MPPPAPRRVPYYEQVAEALRQRIRSGEWPPGHQIPTVTQLAAEHEVALRVVERAQDLLKWEGLLVGHQGKGVFVADPPPEAPPSA